MQAYRFETTVLPEGELQLKRLPFLAGERVEVIVLPLDPWRNKAEQFPLKHTVLKYDDPTEPIPETEWDVLQ